MIEFINEKLVDMYYMYGLADGISPEATRLYQERFLNRVILDRRILANVHRWFIETDILKQNNKKGLRTPEIEEEVLNSIDENLVLSTRKIENNLNIKHVLVWKILHDFLLYLQGRAYGVRRALRDPARDTCCCRIKHSNDMSKC